MIREYRQTDFENLIRVWKSSSRIATPFLSEEFLERETITIRDVYIPIAETWVIEDDGDFVGFLALIENEVGAIFVDPAYQGKGYGKALMDHAKSLRPYLELDVFRDNPIGRTFYNKYGFKFVKEYLHEPSGFIQHRLRLDY